MEHLISTLVKTRLRQDIQSMQSYAIQDAAGMIKLDAMENPHRLAPELQAALGQRLGILALNRYPGARVDVLRKALADHANMPDGYSLMLGNGSDELISLLAMACDVQPAQNGSTQIGSIQPPAILAPEPGFVMYAMSAKFQGLPFVGVPLTADFELDEAAMLAAIAEHKPAIVYLAYPNNPTANLWDDAVIAKIIEAQGQQGGLVVMDEAYQPFAERDSMDRLRRHPHVLVMRTMSKFGLAGVRIGYLMGRTALIDQVDKLRPPFNISVLNAEAGLFALEHVDEYRRQAALIRSERELLLAQLAKLPGVRPYPSQANMVLARVPDAAATFAGMKQRGVLVKNISAMHPLLSNCLRITVGTFDENKLTLAALKASL